MGSARRSGRSVAGPMVRDTVRRIEAWSRALVWNARRGRRSIRRGAGLADKARLLWLYVAYSLLPGLLNACVAVRKPTTGFPSAR